jgi:hypothetical protein
MCPAPREEETMTTVDFEPLSVAVPLWEDPPGVFRVGQSRVLLELVLRAFQRGESPEGIVRSYRTLQLADVYAVIGRYLANPGSFDDYLRLCDEQAQAVRREIETAQGPRVSKEELMARAKAKGLMP